MPNPRGRTIDSGGMTPAHGSGSPPALFDHAAGGDRTAEGEADVVTVPKFPSEVARLEEDSQLPMRHRELSVLDVIAAAARDPRVDVEKLSAMLSLKERLEERDAEKQFTAAFAAMQLEMPRIPKLGVKDMGGKGSIPYAKWEDLDKLIRPVLSKHGFSLSFPTRMVDGKMVMVLVLSHIGGHSKESFMPVNADPGPGRNEIQAVGSGRSYTKRYLTLDALNIITEGADDDGMKAGAITQEQADTINSLISEIGMSDKGRAAFLRLADVDKIENIQRHRYDDILQSLIDKRRSMNR